MKSGRSFLLLLLLPAMLAVTVATLISLWSLHTLQQQNQARNTIEREDLTLLSEASRTGQIFSNTHQRATTLVREAENTRVTPEELRSARREIQANLSQLDQELQGIYQRPRTTHTQHNVVDQLLSDFIHYRETILAALDFAATTPETANPYIGRAQAYFIDSSKHRLTIASQTIDHANRHNLENTRAFNAAFNHITLISSLGLILMLLLSFTAGQLLSRHLAILADALRELTLNTATPPVLAAIERMHQKGIAPLRNMATAVLAFRNAIIELQNTRESLEHHQSHLEELVKERTRELSASEGRLINAQRIAKLGNWEWQLDSGKLYWSDEIYRLLGWEPQSFIPDYDRFLSVIHPDDLDRTLVAINLALNNTADHYAVDHRLLLEDGSIKYVQESGQVLRDAAGKALSMTGVVLDVTDRIKAQEDLELYQLMIENNTDPMFLIDIEDNFRMDYINEAGIRHFGVPRETILRWHLPDWDPNFSREDLPAHRKKVLAQSGGMLFETVHQTAHGLVPVEISVSLTRYKGRLCHFGYFKDISERLKIQDNLLRAKEQAESATLAKSEFLANMSHEIRTPMNAVINLSRLTLQGELNPHQRNNIRKVLRAGEGLLGIINDILDFSKIEAGKLTVEHIPFSLESLIDDITHIAVQRLGNHQVELLLDIPQSLPTEIIGDPLRLKQILTNLMSNAIKFTTHGEVLLKVEILALTLGHTRLCFTVRDTGIGISLDQQTQLFQAFQQADNSITRRYGGTGLGLAICRRLLELMHSQLTLESTPDIGSTFSFILDFDTRLPVAEATAPSSSLKDLRILVIDDNQFARQLLLNVLQQLGAQGDECESGAHAISELQVASGSDMPYDMLLIDWNMPELNGVETLAHIIADPAIQPKPKAILLAAHGNHDFSDHITEAGFFAVVEKPVTASKLLQLMQEQNTTRPDNLPMPLAPAVNLSPLRGKHALIVEDNDINQQIVCELLHTADMEATCAANGCEALNTLHSTPFDLILMDLQMPEMDGYEATRQIRQNPAWKNIPIIAMTAHALSDERERCLNAGMDDHLTKPIDIELLYTTLIRWLPTTGQDQYAMAPKSVDTIELPMQLPEIDVQAGLARVGNNQRLYVKLLRRFLDNQRDTRTTLDDAIAHDRHEQIRQIAHSIKGIAGNLGANSLHQAAARLEQLPDWMNKQMLHEVLTNFYQELGKVRSAIASLDLPVETSLRQALIGDSTHASELLAALNATLEVDYRLARKHFEQLEPYLIHSRYSDYAIRLGQALADYDTDEASRLAHQLSILLSKGKPS